MRIKHCLLLVAALMGASLGLQASESLALSKAVINWRGQGTAQVELGSKGYHNEYEYEDYIGTCSRTVVVGTRTVCKSTPKRRVCTNNGGRRVCTNTGGAGTRGGSSRTGGSTWSSGSSYEPYCYEEDKYDTEYYSCTKTRTITYKILDYTNRAKVKVLFGQLPPGITATDKVFVVELSDAGKVSMAAVGFDKLIVLAKVEQKRTITDEVSEGKPVYQVEATIKVRFVDAKKAMAPVLNGIKDLNIADGFVRFTIGKMQRRSALKFYLEIDRARWWILRDRDMFKGEVREEQVDVVAKRDESEVVIDISKFKNYKPGKKFKGKVSVELIKRPDIINVGGLPSFSISKQFKARERK